MNPTICGGTDGTENTRLLRGGSRAQREKYHMFSAFVGAKQKLPSEHRTPDSQSQGGWREFGRKLGAAGRGLQISMLTTEEVGRQWGAWEHYTTSQLLLGKLKTILT